MTPKEFSKALKKHGFLLKRRLPNAWVCDRNGQLLAHVFLMDTDYASISVDQRAESGMRHRQAVISIPVAALSSQVESIPFPAYHKDGGERVYFTYAVKAEAQQPALILYNPTVLAEQEPA